MATDRPDSSASREVSIARVVLPVPELPKNHMPRPLSRFASRPSQKSRTRLTTKASIWVTGGRSKETPRYFAGITESMPRSRARATMRERQSQGQATSSGPRIQPDPSQMPRRHGCRSPSRAVTATSELLRLGHVLQGRALTGGLLDRPLVAGPVGELRIVLEEDQSDGAHGAVAVLGEDQLGASRVLRFLVVVVVAVEEADEVGVLLDCTGLAQVREDRALVGALLGRAGELRDADHRDIQLPGKNLQAAAELGHLLDAVGAGVVASHQLEVVDDDQPEALVAAAALLGVQAPGLGAQLEQAEVRGVVDPEGGGLELVAGLHDLRPVLAGDLALAQTVARDPRLRADEAVGELHLRHLQGEEGDRLLVLHGDVLGEVADQRRLPHGGPGRDHDQVPRLEAARLVVELAEAGGCAGDLGVPAGELLELVDLVVEDVADLAEVVGLLLVRDLEEQSLRVLDQGPRLSIALRNRLLDLLGGALEAPHQRVLLDDLRVVLGAAR